MEKKKKKSDDLNNHQSQVLVLADRILAKTSFTVTGSVKSTGFAAHAEANPALSE